MGIFSNSIDTNNALSAVKKADVIIDIELRKIIDFLKYAEERSISDNRSFDCLGCLSLHAQIAYYCTEELVKDASFHELLVMMLFNKIISGFSSLEDAKKSGIQSQAGYEQIQAKVITKISELPANDLKVFHSCSNIFNNDY